MQCPNCHATMPNGAKFCTDCGAKLPVQPDPVPNVPQAAPTPAMQQPGAPQTPPDYDAQPSAAGIPLSAAAAATVKLKWFKFLIYFSLWATGVVSVVNAVSYFTGSALGLGADLELVYAYFPMLKVLMIFCGVESIAYGVFAIYTRYQLARFRRNGPACLYALYLIEILFTLLVQIAGSLILGEWTTELGTTVGSLVGSGLFLALNVVYFRKRAQLFVN